MTPLESQLRASLSAARGPAPRVLAARDLPSATRLSVIHDELRVMIMYRKELHRRYKEKANASAE